MISKLRAAVHWPLLVVLLLLGWQPAAAFERDRLSIVTQDGRRHDFDIEIAVTPEDKAQGLMHRETLAPDAGMLFIYNPPIEVLMWMKNTLVPLDMLFLAGDGTIVSIAENTVPLSTTNISAGGFVNGVLEVNAGTAERLRIGVGDRVDHPAFQILDLDYESEPTATTQ